MPISPVGARRVSSRPEAAALRLDRVGQRRVAGRVVGHQRQRADAHHVVGRERGQHAGRIDVREHRHRDCDRIRGMQKHDRGGARTLPVHRPVEEGLLGGRVARQQRAGLVEQTDARRVEQTEARSGGRHQPAAVGQARADVAGAAMGQAAVVQRTGHLRDTIAQSILGHQSSIASATGTGSESLGRDLSRRGAGVGAQPQGRAVLIGAAFVGLDLHLTLAKR